MEEKRLSEEEVLRRIEAALDIAEKNRQSDIDKGVALAKEYIELAEQNQKKEGK